ncbi:serine/threonine-protein kinase [Candidatus Nitrospira bockiana]
MVRTWGWLGQYAVAMLLAPLAAAFLSQLPLFRSTTLGHLAVTAAVAARITGNGLALYLLWRMATRLSLLGTADDEPALSFLRHIVRPFSAVLMVFLAHKTLVPHLLPLLGDLGRMAYPWLFIAASMSAAAWFTLTWVGHVALLRDSVRRWVNARAAMAASSPSVKQGGTEAVCLSDGRERTLILKPADVTRRLGRYHIIRELGRGSMGIVYLGQDPKIHRCVAIKTMRLDLEDPEHLKEVRDRFFREAESTGRLTHPNIITIFDAGEEGELGYIAMEFLEGTTLSAWCRRGQLLAPKRAVELAATVADALDYAHEHGVVHRDIKPSNIMVTKDHKVKVMDFGVARMMSASKSQTTAILGTPSYMSPEQVAGEQVDGRSDVFSLGVVLFELLTSEKPFEAENLSSLLFKIAHEPPPRLRAKRPDLPTALEAIIDRALEKELERRYRYARDLAHALRESLQMVAV